jgi:neutral ceramidase
MNRLRALALCLFGLNLPHVHAGPLRAGADITDITPLPSHYPISTAGSMSATFLDGTEERIHCRTLMLGDEKTLVSFTLVDSCLIPRELADSAKRIASEKTGIPAEHFTIAATHTHSAPTATPAFQSNPSVSYQIYLAERIADSIAAAFEKLEPAEAGWAVGENRDQVFNRRWFVTEPYANPFGDTTDEVRMNPGHNKGGGKVSKPAAPVDPSIPLLAVRSSQGDKKPIGLLANYALHYVGNPPRSADGKAQLSGDYFDRFAKVMAEKVAPGRKDYIAILSNGTSGDINNANYAGPAPEKKYEPGEKMLEVAKSVADSAYSAFAKIEYQTDFPIVVAARELDIGVRKPDAAELARAHEILSSPEQLISGNLKPVEAIYARETLQLREYPDTVPVRLQAYRLGDLCILTTPCETFVEIGLELKQLSPFGTTMVIELANGYNGYLPTPQQHGWGGYETWRAKSSYLEVKASVKMIDAFKELFGDLAGN